VDPAEEVLSLLGPDELATPLPKICMILSCALQQNQVCIAKAAKAYRLEDNLSTTPSFFLMIFQYVS
jgi:hypothetical protein